MNSSNKIRKMRIPVELQQLAKTTRTHAGIACTPSTGGDLSRLVATVPGPRNSPYERGLFKISISINDQYPFRPPAFKFLTPVYHPNIDSAGNICLDLLRMPPTGSYNPAITLESILLSIQLLLATPNPDDPLRGDAADLYRTNRAQFDEKAREHVEQHGTAEAPAETPAKHLDGDAITIGDESRSVLKTGEQ